MRSHTEPFEFHATLSHLDEGLEALHESVRKLREASGRSADDRNLMHFEIALAEIGANVLTHGRPAGTDPPVEYRLWLDDDTAHASFVDGGPPVEEVLSRAMPDQESEAGRGLPMARWLLDDLLYKRDGEVNRWRLVKRL
ncbi:MAG TPA: ATP-binding protein [Candidatus Dormibacteraeota bacterium]|nr:ATP-binding protein [Candidatus Dormibacteraeota bacterium]